MVWSRGIICSESLFTLCLCVCLCVPVWLPFPSSSISSRLLGRVIECTLISVHILHFLSRSIENTLQTLPHQGEPFLNPAIHVLATPRCLLKQLSSLMPVPATRTHWLLHPKDIHTFNAHIVGVAVVVCGRCLKCAVKGVTYSKLLACLCEHCYHLLLKNVLMVGLV